MHRWRCLILIMFTFNEGRAVQKVVKWSGAFPRLGKRRICISEAGKDLYFRAYEL